ncbi:MAG: DUF2076 family protein, partial [Acetobacteraceae bacterium]|nr:DUF2076 family protein [Acetobacteraceae bacterium]
PPPPQPVYPPGYNPGMLQPQRAGSGFLGTALTTAAGVAGGMFLGNMLMNALGGHGGMAHATGLTGGGFGQEAVPTTSPWTDPAAAAAEQGWGSGGGGQQDAWGAPDDATQAGYDSDFGGAEDASGYDDGGDEEI